MINKTLHKILREVLLLTEDRFDATFTKKLKSLRVEK